MVQHLVPAAQLAIRRLPLPHGGRERYVARTPISRKTRSDNAFEKTTPTRSVSGPMCADNISIATGRSLVVAASHCRLCGSTPQAEALLVQKSKPCQRYPRAETAVVMHICHEQIKLNLHHRSLKFMVEYQEIMNSHNSSSAAASACVSKKKANIPFHCHWKICFTTAV